MFRGIKSSLKNLKIILFLMKIFKHNRNKLKHNRNKHTLVFGSPGSGKTFCFVKPNLETPPEEQNITKPTGDERNV